MSVKNICGILLAGLIAVSLSACDSSVTDTGSSPSATTATPVVTTTETPKLDGEGIISKCNIKMVSATKGKDYKDRDTIVVSYTWTNGKDEEAMFSTTFSAKAYQNGTELDTAINLNDDSASDCLKNIKPGVEQTITQAYVLTDTSDVSVEAKAWISITDNTVVSKTFSVA